MGRPFVLVAVLWLMACGDDLTSPENRTLPETAVNVTLTTCLSCPRDTTPEDLLVFQEGVKARIRIADADPSVATLTVLRITSSQGADLLDRLRDTTIELDWTTEAAGGPAFFGGIGWGSDADIFFSFRRSGLGLSCGLGFITARHDVGGTSCRID